MRWYVALAISALLVARYGDARTSSLCAQIYPHWDPAIAAAMAGNAVEVQGSGGRLTYHVGGAVVSDSHGRPVNFPEIDYRPLAVRENPDFSSNEHVIPDLESIRPEIEAALRRNGIEGHVTIDQSKIYRKGGMAYAFRCTVTGADGHTRDFLIKTLDRRLSAFKHSGGPRTTNAMIAQQLQRLAGLYQYGVDRLAEFKPAHSDAANIRFAPTIFDPALMNRGVILQQLVEAAPGQQLVEGGYLDASGIGQAFRAFSTELTSATSGNVLSYLGEAAPLDVGFGVSTRHAYDPFHSNVFASRSTDGGVTASTSEITIFDW